MRGVRKSKRTHSVVPTEPHIIEAVEKLKKGKTTGDLADEYGVSPQTIDRWFFRWVVYPEWVVLKTESETPKVKTLTKKVKHLTVTVEKLKQYIRDNVGVEIDV